MKWIANNKEKVVVAGGIKAVVKAIKRHTNNTYVYENGCIALNSMTLRISKKKSY